jgi:hypothetical protein
VGLEEVLTEVAVKSTISCDVTAYIPVVHSSFGGGRYCFHPEDGKVYSPPKCH